MESVKPDGMDLYTSLFYWIEEGQKTLSEASALGEDYAKKRRDYDVAKRKAELYERSNGTPVTIIQDVVHGRDDIAQLRLQKTCAEVIYKNNEDRHNFAKRCADIIRDLIKIERSVDNLMGR